MRVTILAVGHKMPAWIQEGFLEYARRMPPEVRVELVELKPGKTKSEEGKRMLAALPERAHLVALDERGKSVSTQALCAMLSRWMADGMSPVFAIGGADGLAEEVKERANEVISLSAMTLPHQLVRVVLVEQLYRAWSVLARHPYHRE